MSNKFILLNDFTRQWENTKTTALAAFERVGSSGHYILGHEVETFESRLAQEFGLKCAVGVANGMDALEISLRALGLKPGEKVLTTPMSAFATTLAILRAGGRPVFCDTDENGNLNLALARNCLLKNSDIKYLVPVHLYGNSLNLNELLNLKEEFKLKIVEDCAQSIGAEYKGVPVGSVGQLSACSFYPTKNLGCMGDGGAIVTNDEGLASACKMLRNYGQSKRYHHSLIGLNSRLDELQAALLNSVYLPRLKQWNQQRLANAKKLMSSIRSSKIRILNSKNIENSSWHLFVIEVLDNKRSDFSDFLDSKNIQNAIHYPILIPNQQAMLDKEFEIFGDLRIANRLANQIVSIPIHPYLTLTELEYMSDELNKFGSVT